MALDSDVGDVELKDYMRMMDVASEVRRQQEEVEKQFDMDEQKEAIRAKLLATAEVTGEELTEEQADAAIEHFFSGLYAFKEPERDFSYKLAEMYVDRGRIFRRYFIPAFLIAAVAGVIWLGTSLYNSAKRAAFERRVEAAVLESYNEKVRLENAIKAFPDKPELREIKTNSQVGLITTEDFFKKYCSDGTSADDITYDNAAEAEQKLEAIAATLGSVREQVDKGNSMIKYERDLGLTRQSLDSLIKEIRSSRPPAVLLTKAESAYKSGLATIENRQLAEGQKYRQQLAAVKSDVQQFAVLPSRVEQLYSSIKTTAREPAAIEQANRLYAEAKSYIDSINVSQLKQTVNQLDRIDRILNQAYTIRIVSRRGVKSGIDRYYTDESGKRLSGYYLIVEAIDASGRAIPLDIINEENGVTSTVTMWGERIPKEIYDQVRRDKLDNGIINNNVLGKKQKGYLDEQMIMIRKSEGRITQW